MKITATEKDVIVVLRHDPNSSDPVEVAAVLQQGFFDGPGITVPEDKRIEVAEAWAVQREIEFIRADEDANADGPLTADQRAWARDLTADNFTKKTDIWFSATIIPLLDYEVESPV